MLGLENKILPITNDRVAGKFRLTWSRNQINEYTPEIDEKLKQFFSAEASDDESIYDCARNKFGQEFADYVISPMVAGITAGSAKEISAKFLVKGRGQSNFEPTELYKKAQSNRWSFYSLEGGIGTLPQTIERKLAAVDKVSLNVNSKCSKIHFESDGSAKLTVNDKDLKTSFIVSSLPSYQLAPLLEHQHPELAGELSSIPSADVATVNLFYPSSDLLQHKGFGVFVPPIENSSTLGIIFDSNCFKMKGTVLTVMLSGDTLRSNPSEEILLDSALQSAKQILNIAEKPSNFKVNILRKSFPQYTVGHYNRIDRIRSYIKAHKLPLALCGQSYDGIGINEVILSSKIASEDLGEL